MSQMTRQFSNTLTRVDILDLNCVIIGPTRHCVVAKRLQRGNKPRMPSQRLNTLTGLDIPHFD